MGRERADMAGPNPEARDPLSRTFEESRPPHTREGIRLSPALVAAGLVGAGLGLGVALAARAALSGAPGGGSPRPVRYRDDVESVPPDEGWVTEQIIAAMRRMNAKTRPRYGRAVRTSHAKAHGLLTGELRVLDGLPPELRQGLFARARAYPVIVRLSHVPSEILDDRRNSHPRGMSLKVLDVEGEMLPGHRGETTQDWVLDTGKVFPSPGPRAFLATFATIERFANAPQGLKEAFSQTSRALNAALTRLGIHSANLDFFGHPPRHPLGEVFYSQVPFRYGDYIAKMSVTPVSPGLRAVFHRHVDDRGPDALRTTTVEFFREHGAEFEIGIQLCTDLGRMPIENALAEWPEDESPYRPVARLILPRQEAYTAARQAYIDEALAFCPAHSLAAHRPLGGISRARMKAYEEMSALRRQENGLPLREPRSIREVPA